MHVREATLDDTAAIVAMGTEFIAELPYGDADPKTAGPRIVARLEQAMAMGKVLVGEDEKGLTGMLAFVVGEHPLVGSVMAFEVAWWVEPRARHGATAHKLLFKSFEMAKAMGCERIQFGAPSEVVAKLYSKVGMRAVEATFIKEL
jgi:hypothetical protein